MTRRPRRLPAGSVAGYNLVRTTVAAACAVATLLGPTGASGRAGSTSQPAVTQPAATRPTAEECFAEPAGGWPRSPTTGKINRVALRCLARTKLRKKAWFHLAVPKEYTPRKTWPLMVVLHGGPGGKPGDVAAFYRGGLTAAGVISVYPNALQKQLLEWNYPHSGAYLLRIVQQVASEYRIDPRRVYLTGVSMGGGGTWVQGALGREVYAAIGPVSGWYGASHSPSVKLLKEMPIYFMHGGKDRNVPVLLGRRAMAALKGIGRDVATCRKRPEPADIAEASCVYREIPEAGHNCFRPWKDRGRHELGLMVQWLLARRRATPADVEKAMERIARHGRKFGWSPVLSPIGGYGQSGKGNETSKGGKQKQAGSR